MRSVFFTCHDRASESGDGRALVRALRKVRMLCALLLLVSWQAQATGFSSAGSLANSRGEHTATLLPSGRVLVVGGYNGSASLASAELYDPAGNDWVPVAPPSAARRAHTATLLPNGKVLVTGGYDGLATLASAELYDPSSNSWKTTAGLNFARRAHSATLLSNGKVLVAGGYDSIGNVLSSAELYDPASNKWSDVGSLALPRALHAAVRLSSGRVLVAGGRNNSGFIVNAELYDPGSGSWGNGGTLVVPRIYHAATLLSSGKVLVTGGQNSSATDIASAELYNPTSNSWGAAASLAVARKFHTATRLSGGKVLVAGGLSNGNYLASAAIYDPAGNAWAATGGSLAFARAYHSATLLASGKVLLAAGRNGGGNISSAELYAQSSQAITFSTLPNKVLGDAPFAISASASSGLPVSFSSLTSAVCTVSGSVVTLKSRGKCSVAADQAGNADYLPAPRVTRSFYVKTGQTITFGPLGDKTYGDPPFTIFANASSGLGVSFSSLMTTVCTVKSGKVTLVGAGTCTISANQAGNSSYLPAPEVTQAFTVNKGSQSIKFDAIANRDYSDVPFNVSASASSKLAVSLASSTMTLCRVSGNSVTMLRVGNCAIVASQEGNNNYLPAVSIIRTFSITPGSVGLDCSFMPAHAAFKSALLAARDQDIGGSGQVWGVLVNRTGMVCAVAYTGNTLSEQPLEARLRAAALASTANAFSVDALFLSSANLYGPQQTGWLNATGFELPVDATRGYASRPGQVPGSPADPLLRLRIGGVLAMGGGLALMDLHGRGLGAIGVAGINPCVDHNLAWRARGLLNLDYVPAGMNADDPSRPDNILYQGQVSDANAAYFTHPACSNAATAASSNLPATRQ